MYFSCLDGESGVRFVGAGSDCPFEIVVPGLKKTGYLMVMELLWILIIYLGSKNLLFCF